MFDKKGGLMTMVYAILGVVVYVSLFPTIMGLFDDLLGIAGIDDLLILPVVLRIVPTLLLLGGIAVSAFAYWKGEKTASVTDSNGLMRMVVSVLGIVLFLSLFFTVAETFVDLYADYGDGGTYDYIALGIAIAIAPTVLFLGGVGSFIATGVGGYKANKKNKASTAVA